MPVDRKRLMIGAAVVAVIAAVFWFWPSTPAPGVAVGTAASVRPAQSAAGIGPVGPVKLDALTSTHEEPGSGARNPFRFQPKAAPPPPKLVVPPPSMAVTEPVRPAVPAGPPPPPPIPLKFIGVLEVPNMGKVAVFSDCRTTMRGREGDIIDGRYRLVRIGVESVVMEYADGRGRTTIRMSGQECVGK